MTRARNFLAILWTIALSTGSASALSVDEIIKLKRAGVSDSTIELLIKRDGDVRAAGVWRQDGWIIHSTPSRSAESTPGDYFYLPYPVEVYPQFYGAWRFWPPRR